MPCRSRSHDRPITVAEIAVRLAAGRRAAGQWFHKGEVIEEAEALHAELVARGHIAPEPAPVAGPDWSQAPEWAQWAACDSSGVWFWYEMQPFVDIDRWIPERLAHMFELLEGEPDAAAAERWRESLQRRPGGG